VASPAELLEHLEESLGPLNESKSVAESALEARGLAAISVLAFGRDPTEPSAHVTFGLSRHFLEGDGGTVVQELVIPVADRDFALGALTAIGGHVLKTHRALMPGERHRLHGWSGISRVGGVIVVPDPALRPFAAADPPVDFVRLLPITDSEAAFATQYGWQALAARLTAAGVNIRDLLRSPVA
jgi:hypothetical protein